MRAYSIDLRERVLADCDGGLGTRAVARKYRVSEAWVRRLKQRRRETGRVAPVEQRHGPKPGWEPHAAAIRAAVRAAPDLTLDEYRARLALPVSRSALARALVALRLSRKKSRPGPASRTGRTSGPSGRRGGRPSRGSTPGG
jgi:transposase